MDFIKALECLAGERIKFNWKNETGDLKFYINRAYKKGLRVGIKDIHGNVQYDFKAKTAQEFINIVQDMMHFGIQAELSNPNRAIRKSRKKIRVLDFNRESKKTIV